MKVHGKLHSISLVSASLILLLILVSSTASAATTTSNVAGIDYQYEDWDQYPVIDLFGEKYVPLYEENDPIWKSHVDRIAKLVIDSKGSYSFTTGDIFDLGQGYSLQVKQVDVDGNKVWLEFDKNGQYVDDQILSTEYGGNTWNCTLDNIQGVKNVVVLKVYVNQITQNETESVVQIGGIWLIDYENTMTLKIDDKFGDYTLKDIIYGVNSSYLGSLVFDYEVTITDLGTLGGSYSLVSGINNKGQIVGESETETGEYHAFLWHNGVMDDLGTLGEPNSHAYEINEKEQIIGNSYAGFDETDEHQSHAFLWQNGVMTSIGTLGGPNSVASGINEKGQIIGDSETELDEDSDMEPDNHAFLWQNGVMTDLGTLGGTDSYAWGINENEQVVGWSYTENSTRYEHHAFLWQNGTMTDLGTLGGFDSTGIGITDKGHVVGWSNTKTGEGHAFLWQNGTMTDLGTLGGSYSSVSGINDNDQIVGESETETGEQHAFLWQNGMMADIGTLPGGSRSWARGINEKGQVIGYSETETGDTHAFLWQNGVMTDLETLPGGSYSYALGINDNDQIMGESETGTGEIDPDTGIGIRHAVLWTLPASNTRPVANFSASRTSRYAPLTVNFTDQSTNSPTAWNWDFGDGSINSTLQNPAHTYSTAGNYTVALTASNAAGSSTVTGIVHVTPPEGSEDIVSEIEVSDNRLREASPDTVYKTSSFIDVGGMNKVRYRDVIGFNLSEYNSDTSIENASLSLYWYYPAGKTRPKDTIVEVYRPASAWNSDYVSWNKKDKNIAWKNTGGDWYDKNGVLQGSTPYASITIKGSSLPDNKYYELNVTDLVKEYVTGKYENTGFLIKARKESNNYIAFYSSDCGNEKQVPKLQLVYS